MEISAHWGALLVGIVITSLSQILLRSGAVRGETWVKSILNVRVITGYMFFFGVTILNLYALKEIPFKVLSAWVSLPYILTPLLAFLLLKERLHRNNIIGGIFIILGITLFSLAP